MEFQIINEALRALFLVGFPLVAVTAVAGTIVSAFMAATTIQEASLGYAVRLAAVVAVLYFVMPVAIRSLTTLGEMALK